MNKAFLNWSGGKDSALSLYHILQEKKFDVKLLVTTLSMEYQRISMHGVRAELLNQQASCINLPLHKIWLPEMPSMEVYNEVMRENLLELKRTGIGYSIFGDIFLEDLRKYREEKLKEVGLKGQFPLWKRNTEELINEFIDLGFKAILVCVDERCLEKSFVGRIIDRKLINDLPENVDPCGENGEYHSFVFDGPLFEKPVPFKKGEVVYKQYDDPTIETNKKTGFWYQDILPVD